MIPHCHVGLFVSTQVKFFVHTAIAWRDWVKSVPMWLLCYVFWKFQPGFKRIMCTQKECQWIMPSFENNSYAPVKVYFTSAKGRKKKTDVL